MTEVWVLAEHDYDDTVILGVFNKPDAAKAVAEQQFMEHYEKSEAWKAKVRAKPQHDRYELANLDMHGVEWLGADWHATERGFSRSARPGFTWSVLRFMVRDALVDSPLSWPSPQQTILLPSHLGHFEHLRLDTGRSCLTILPAPVCACGLYTLEFRHPHE